MAMLLFMLVSSFLAMPNLISVEARKLTASNGGVFKVDLIHRDSPHSPYYNSSMTPKERLKKLPLGYISRGHNVQLSSTYYNTSNIDLIPAFGEYLIKIAIGTPKVEFFTVADTGSNLIWVQCLPCESCVSDISSPFDPTKSSTFQAIPCNTAACNRPLYLHTGCPLENTTKSSSPCHYRTTYGTGSSSGILARETISLSASSDTTSLSLPSIVFGCGMNQTVIPEDGIIGLGLGPSSLIISQMGLESINYKFSYCLPPLNSDGNGTLAFGADITGSGVVSTPFFTVNHSTHYYLMLNGIRVGDDDVQMPSSLDIFIDSGTTLTYLPTSVYGNVKTTLKTAIRLTTTPSPYKLYDLCYNIGGQTQFNVPNVVFRFKGADVTLKAENLFREVDEAVICLAMVASDNLFILGNIAQSNFHIGYDIKEKQVSFAPANCTNF